MRRQFAPHWNRWTAAAVTLAMTAAAQAAVLGTSFSYQGRLEVGGNPANGLFDFRFRLYDASGAGAQVGGDYLANDVTVTDGLFTTTIDFGATSFSDQARWIEIAVHDGGGYVPLTPRQAVTAAPVALFAMNGNWTKVGSAITNSNAPGFVGVNRSARVTTAEYFGIQAPVASGFGGMYIRTDGDSGVPFYGYKAGDTTAAWTYYDGATGEWGVHANSGDRLIINADGEVGIGDTTPDAKLDVFTDVDSQDGISATATGSFSHGVRASGLSAGVRGDCGTSNGAGVEGVNNSATGTGVLGTSSGAGGAAGMAGYAPNGTGVYGQTGSGWGVYGSNGGSNVTGYAGYFNGRMHVNGQLSKNSGSFKIDHPLDPANKYLYHSFVESPDMMNIYNGNVVLDANGEATVTMPDWFDALNFEFRYQLTTIGGFAPVFVKSEMANGKFAIGGGTAGLKVSWQVTGIRQDAYAKAHRIQVEEEKPASEKGKFLTPEVFGQPAEMGVGYRGPARAEQVEPIAE